jgi:hypothetical protein
MSAYIVPIQLVSGAVQLLNPGLILVVSSHSTFYIVNISFSLFYFI